MPVATNRGGAREPGALAAPGLPGNPLMHTAAHRRSPPVGTCVDAHRAGGIRLSRPSQDIRFCTSRDGTRIAFASSGSGPPLLCAGHSFSHLEHEWDCEVWRPLLDLLGQGRTLVRYDMRGTGLSDRDGLEFTLTRYQEDLEAVVAAAGLTQFNLLGMTGGGALAVTHAARHPQQVSRLVLLGCYLQGRSVRSKTTEQRQETELILKLVELGWGQDNPTFRQLFTYQFVPDATSAQLQAFNELMRQSARADQAAALLRAWFDADLSAIAPRLHVPTLVLHAQGDLRIPYDQGRALAAHIPGARFVSLESRNHILLDHEPAWTQWAAELEAFLAAPARAPASNRGQTGPTGQTGQVGLAGLTAKEEAVLAVLVQGLGTTDMAERLGIAEKTLRNHLSVIYSKLGVANRAQAIVCAHAQGLPRK